MVVSLALGPMTCFVEVVAVGGVVVVFSVVVDSVVVVGGVVVVFSVVVVDGVVVFVGVEVVGDVVLIELELDDVVSLLPGNEVVDDVKVALEWWLFSVVMVPDELEAVVGKAVVSAVVLAILIVSEDKFRLCIGGLNRLKLVVWSRIGAVSCIRLASTSILLTSLTVSFELTTTRLFPDSVLPDLVGFLFRILGAIK